jgi:hypothetical protein
LLMKPKRGCGLGAGRRKVVLREVKPKRVWVLWLDLTKKAKEASTRGDQGPGESALRRT